MIFHLGKDHTFPAVSFADSEGLLAVGGDLSPERLLVAYSNGIFPWFNDDNLILWWSPDPRFVLFPEKLHVSTSMEKVFNRKQFHFTINTSFEKVIAQCKNNDRKGQEGTWITDKVLEAYVKLHKLGHAISAETWLDGELVGGVYGIKMGHVFFGESMFSLVNNASKFAFISYVKILQQQGLKLVDCQVYTDHLQSLGAEFVSRDEFGSMLKKWTGSPHFDAEIESRETAEGNRM